MARVELSVEELRPVVQAIVQEVLSQLEQRQLLVNGKLALTEAEAAELIGLNPWQLRDVRLNGKITHSRIVGNRVRYTLKDIQKYLDSGRDAG